MFLRLRRGDTVGSGNVITLSGKATANASNESNIVTDSIINGCTYRPVIPTHDVTRLSYIYRDGADITNIVRQNVVESCDLTLGLGTSSTGIATVIEEIQIYFLQAERKRETGLGDRIWIEYNAYTDDDTTEVQRSELLVGRIDLGDKSLTQLIESGKLTLTLVWERRPWWEAAGELELLLANGNGGPATGGIAIKNHDDGDAGDDNWVNISLPSLSNTDSSMSLPSATRIEITNNSSRDFDRVYIAYNSQAGGTSFRHIFEGEDRTIGTGSTISNTTASGGQYYSYSWATTATQVVAAWNLTSTFSQTAAGDYFRIMAFLFEKPGDGNYKMRFKAQSTTGLDLLETDWVALDQNRHIQEIATVRWPPKLRSQTGIHSMRYALEAKHTTTASHTVKLDFVQWSPMDGWRKIFAVARGADTNEKIIDNGIDQIDPYLEISNKKFPELVGYGNQIELDHDSAAPTRMYFLMEAETNETTSATMSATVRVYYRPRRLFPGS